MEKCTPKRTGREGTWIHDVRIMLEIISRGSLRGFRTRPILLPDSGTLASDGDWTK